MQHHEQLALNLLAAPRVMANHRPWNVVDLFAGGGGASEGIRQALGVEPAVAVNHCLAAIKMHEANHPTTLHLCENVLDVDPVQTTGGAPIDLLWASPDCTHFSRAKGGKPRKQEIRALAWVVVRWAKATLPTVIGLENVPEFTTWGPLDQDGQPDPDKKGETFHAWVGALEALGYAVAWRTLRACDYGAPTSRKRLLLVARRDGKPIRWPEPTHGPKRPRPWPTARECIDWTEPVCSIFATQDEANAWAAANDRSPPKRPLAAKTEARIFEGLRRYVLETDNPRVVDEHLVGALVQTGYGERKGQRPRALDLEAPLGTVVAGGGKHALVVAWMAKHYGGVVGHELDRPLGTITATDHHSLCLAFLTKYYGAGTGQHQAIDTPLDTITSKARFGLVVVEGQEHVITDIGMRMLTPRELARCQGFDDSYVLTGTKTEQTARIGNSVPPQLVRAVIAANITQETSA